MSDSGDPVRIEIVRIFEGGECPLGHEVGDVWPVGLYGTAFPVATDDEVRRATTRIDPPPTSNMIAIAAPRGGSGSYRRETIREVLEWGTSNGT